MMDTTRDAVERLIENMRLRAGAHERGGVWGADPCSLAMLDAAMMLRALLAERDRWRVEAMRQAEAVKVLEGERDEARRQLDGMRDYEAGGSQ